MTELDRELENYLTGMVEALGVGRLFPCSPRPTAGALQQAVAAAAPDGGFAPLFEKIKFARLMKGRLWFYAQEVPWFDSPPLVRNELNRIGANFYQSPLRLFARLVHGENLSVEQALERLEGEIFDAKEAAACRRFGALACAPCPDPELRRRALEISAVFDPFLCAMEHLLDFAKAL